MVPADGSSRVTVPSGIKEGEQFQANTPGGAMIVTGDNIQIQGAPRPMAMTRTRSEAEQELLQRSLQNSTWKGQFRSAEGLICCHLMYAEATVDNLSITWKQGGCSCCCIPCRCEGEPMRGTIEPSGMALKLGFAPGMGPGPNMRQGDPWHGQLDPNQPTTTCSRPGLFCAE